MVQPAAVDLVNFGLRLGAGTSTLHFVQVVWYTLLCRSKVQLIARKVIISVITLVRAHADRLVHFHGARVLTSQVHCVRQRFILSLNMRNTGEI